MNHEDRCTLLKNGGDERDILTRKLFDVNMRLFRTNELYKGLVEAVASYMVWNAQHEFPGYKRPHGFSGANAGIPWNIIALADGSVLINPKIVGHSSEVRVGLSNCGSLLLDQPIKVARFQQVEIDYFSLDGAACHVSGWLPTHQHEIDHNLGILITDRQVTI